MNPQIELVRDIFIKNESMQILRNAGQDEREWVDDQEPNSTVNTVAQLCSDSSAIDLGFDKEAFASELKSLHTNPNQRSLEALGDIIKFVADIASSSVRARFHFDDKPSNVDELYEKVDRVAVWMNDTFVKPVEESLIQLKQISDDVIDSIVADMADLEDSMSDLENCLD